VITNRWVVIGAYFLVVVLVSLAWFARPTLHWQGARVPTAPRIYDTNFYGNPDEDIAPAQYEPPRSPAAPGEWVKSAPGDGNNPAVPAAADHSAGATESAPAPAPVTGSQTPPASAPVPAAAKPSVQPAPTPSQNDAHASGGALPFDHLIYPVEGEVSVTNPYAELARSTTFNDWRAHLAVDLAANVGADVCAAASGTVKQILQNDRLWGTVVILSHGNGCHTTYSSLENVTVQVGQSVAAGQRLGKLVGSPPAEQLELSHLHFQLLEGEEALDPTPLFGE
jgi:murein DD-endopeptidase MepM/ murein hydrolase activator NlpD